jgi:hypothetical protein
MPNTLKAFGLPPPTTTPVTTAKVIPFPSLHESARQALQWQLCAILFISCGTVLIARVNLNEYRMRETPEVTIIAQRCRRRIPKKDFLIIERLS